MKLMADKLNKLLSTFRYYFKIWSKFTSYAFSVSLTSRFNGAIFLTAKVLRIAFFLLFIIIIIRQTKHLSGYTETQVILFYLSFNLVDNLTQLLYREVYRFRSLVVQGQFDYVLLKPMSSLFRSLLGGADVLDLIMMIPILITLIYYVTKLPNINLLNISLYIILIVNAVLLSTAFHIMVLSLGILTTTVDHGIMIYRDLTSLGRVPVDIYKEPLRGIITFVIPIAIMMTLPAKTLMNLVSGETIIFACLLGIAIFYISLKSWKYAVSKYSSASS